MRRYAATPQPEAKMDNIDSVTSNTPAQCSTVWCMHGS
jgi:hypothetical protein